MARLISASLMPEAQAQIPCLDRYFSLGEASAAETTTIATIALIVGRVMQEWRWRSSMGSCWLKDGYDKAPTVPDFYTH